MTTVYATRTFRAAHVVSLRHASTRARIMPVRVRLDSLPYGWSIRTRGADVVVTTRDGAPVPAAPPVLTVTVMDPLTAAVLASPSADIPLTAAAITHDFAPVPMVLTIELVHPTTGVPRTGRTVKARAGSGPTPRPEIALLEGAPGIYSSTAQVWTTPFTPFDLMVGTNPLRKLAMDFTSPTTIVRLADTT